MREHWGAILTSVPDEDVNKGARYVRQSKKRRAVPEGTAPIALWDLLLNADKETTRKPLGVGFEEVLPSQQVFRDAARAGFC